MIRFSFILLLTSFTSYCPGQSLDIDTSYLNAYQSLNNMLLKNESISFKHAVFITENAFMHNKLDYSKFDEHLSKLATLIDYFVKIHPVKKYNYSDSSNVQKNYSLFKFFQDTLKVLATDSSDFVHLPYSYDFDDFLAKKDWRNMFVSKLLLTHSGNCHSLTYLYKILADELGATCWLSLAPNHIYIKNRCKRDGWYNTELTNGSLPTDAWIMASGYVSLQAVQNGIYMDTLSNQQSIALCIIDLAKGYENQTKNYYDGFIIKCCDLALTYFPNYVQAILLKAETLKRVYEKQLKEKKPEANDAYTTMETLYAKLIDLGYREMPAKMYQDWLFGVQKERRRQKSKLNNTPCSPKNVSE